MKISRDDVAQVLGAAFEIERAKGAELLLALGRFDGWRGDLSSMRGDPAPTFEERPAPSAEGDSILIVARGLQDLQPRCHNALYLRYVERRELGEIATELDTTTHYAKLLVDACFDRLLESLEEGVAQRAASPIVARDEAPRPRADAVRDGPKDS